VLEIDIAGTNTIDNETISLSGSGILDGPSTAVVTTFLGTGALRNLQGTNTVTGNVTIAATNTSIDVAGGSTLTFGGAGVTAFGTSFNTVKTGTGTLQLGGTAANTATTSTLYVNEGTLELDKTAARGRAPKLGGG